ncbi:MAG TPA: hypothetical protein VM238_20425 [Phycisphaerae bacterium]|nr:hypothetical protein [Phycisphaerae bacterium]
MRQASGQQCPSEGHQARDEFVKSLQNTVDSLQANIGKLGALAAAKGTEAKAKYDAEVKPALDKKLEQAKATLAKVKAQSGSTWESMKDAAQTAVDDLGTGYDKAVKMFE